MSATLVTLFVLIALVLVLIWKTSQKPGNADNQGINVLVQQMDNLRDTIDRKISDTNKMMHDSVHSQLGESAKLIREVTEGLTKLDETNRQVVSFADQLQSLGDILKNPKQRGILGEYYLETLLKNVMAPGDYEMQHELGLDENGSKLIPDAIVRVKDKIIPIDSKFSLENYNRLSEAKEPAEKERLAKLFESDLKNRIVETSKYIQPSLGTMDFAFMFIPHEAIYYDLLIGRIGIQSDENLIQRAASKYKVIIVSPTSFLAYLQTVMQALRALHVEEQAVQIKKNVENLIKHIVTYEDFYKKLGNNLSTVVNQYNGGYKELAKMDKDVLKITDKSMGIEVLSIDKPNLE